MSECDFPLPCAIEFFVSGSRDLHVFPPIRLVRALYGEDPFVVFVCFHRFHILQLAFDFEDENLCCNKKEQKVATCYCWSFAVPNIVGIDLNPFYSGISVCSFKQLQYGIDPEAYISFSHSLKHHDVISCTNNARVTRILLHHGVIVSLCTSPISNVDVTSMNYLPYVVMKLGDDQKRGYIYGFWQKLTHTGWNSITCKMFV